MVSLSKEIFFTVSEVANRFYPGFEKLSLQDRKQLNLIYSGLLDSFAVMNFILEIEAAFDIQIPAHFFEDRRMHQLASLCDIIIELKR